MYSVLASIHAGIVEPKSNFTFNDLWGKEDEKRNVHTEHGVRSRVEPRHNQIPEVQNNAR